MYSYGNPVAVKRVRRISRNLTRPYMSSSNKNTNTNDGELTVITAVISVIMNQDKLREVAICVSDGSAFLESSLAAKG